METIRPDVIVSVTVARALVALAGTKYDKPEFMDGLVPCAVGFARVELPAFDVPSFG